MLRKRALSAVIGIPPLAVIIWLGNPWFAILVAAAAAIGFYEFYTMATARNGAIFLVGLLATMLFALSPYFMGDGEGAIFSLLVIFFGVTAVSLFLSRPVGIRDRLGTSPWWLRLGTPLFFGLFLGLAVSFLVRLEWFPHGWRWVLLTLLTVFASDTAAYFVGRAWGRHPLATRISPGKTQEGAVAAFLGAILATMVLTLILNLSIAWWHALLLGSLVGLFGQLGDLAESAVKRSCGAKEAGILIPGHGGILDRLDSILFSGIVVYYFVSLVIL